MKARLIPMTGAAESPLLAVLITLAISVFITITSSTLRAASEQIECSSESLPASWTHVPSDCNGLVACDCIDNTDDVSYIQRSVLGADHTYNFSDPSTIGSGDTIDSVVVTFRYKVTSLEIPLNEIRVELIVSSDTSFGTSRSGNTIWTNHSQPFSSAPSGGAWTLSDVNALRLNMTVVTQNGIVANNVSRMFAVVWFTPGGDQISRRRRVTLITQERGA